MMISLSILLPNSFQKLEGIVIDLKTGKLLKQANIRIVGTDSGVITNEVGQFYLEGPFQFPLKIEVSHIGYKSQIKLINNYLNEKIEIELVRELIEMKELVVTGTRTKRLHKNVPIATEVISKKEIKNSGARNVADLLSQRSGVSLQTSVEGGSVLNILGMDSRYILILVDGQPITGRFNNRVSLDQILTNQLSKIEIVKGPNSSLYGSEAMAGVINIITNKDNKSNLIDLSIRHSNTKKNMQNNGLKNGSNNFGLNIVKPFKKIKVQLNASLDNIQNDQSIELIEIDQINKMELRGNIDWEINNRNAIYFVTKTYGQIEKGASKLMNTNTDINRSNYSLSYRARNQRGWNFNQTITSNFYSRNYIQKRPWGKLEKDDLTSEEYVEYEFLLNKKIKSNEFNAGFEIYRATYSSDRIKSYKQQINNQSLFSQYDLNLSNQLNMILGMRLDEYSEYHSVLSPRVGLMYQFQNNWKFRTSWGRGFRAPSFMERYIDWNHVQFNYTVKGNPDLKPESSNGITLGFEYDNRSSIQYSLMLYHTEFENLIEDFTIQPGLLSYQNIEKAKFSGIEFLSKIKISRQWNGQIGFNWIDNRDSDNKTIPNTIPFSISNILKYNSPQNSFNFLINTKWVTPYHPQEYDAEKGLYIFAEKKLNGYTLINIRAAYNINKVTKINFGVQNAGNYMNDKFGPFNGRLAYLEISTQIIKGE